MPRSRHAICTSICFRAGLFKFWPLLKSENKCSSQTCSSVFVLNTNALISGLFCFFLTICRLTPTLKACFSSIQKRKTLKKYLRNWVGIFCSNWKKSFFFSSKLGLAKEGGNYAHSQDFWESNDREQALCSSSPQKKLLKVRLVMIDDDGKQKVYSKLLPL